MAAVQAEDEDVRNSFLFVGDLKGHHRKWLGSRYGVPAFDFATVSGCDQLVVGPTYARGGRLDLPMTDVPDLVQVAVVAPIGNSDHSSLSADILWLRLLKFYGSGCFPESSSLLEYSVWCNTGLPWHNIWSADNPVEV